MFMKGAVKSFLKEWVIPPKIYLCLLELYLCHSIKNCREDFTVISKNSFLKDKYKGKRCFVIGNGPSLNKVDLSRLDGEITIVMNYFNKNPILEKWQPTVYCAADPPSSYTPVEINLMKDVPKKIFPKDGYFFPISVRKLFEENKLFPGEKSYYLDMGKSIDLWDNTNNDLDFTKTIPSVQSTAQLAILLAIYLGCDEIFLLGLDHNWLAYRDCLSAPHFYPETATKNNPPGIKSLKYLDFIKSALVLFKGYENIHNYARRRGIKIVNLTEGSYLDEFSQKHYTDVV